MCFFWGNPSLETLCAVNVGLWGGLQKKIYLIIQVALLTYSSETHWSQDPSVSELLIHLLTSIEFFWGLRFGAILNNGNVNCDQSKFDPNMWVFSITLNQQTVQSIERPVLGNKKIIQLYCQATALLNYKDK